MPRANERVLLAVYQLPLSVSLSIGLGTRFTRP